MPEHIPSEKNWDEYAQRDIPGFKGLGYLDYDYAKKTFLGKSVDEAVGLLEQNVMLSENIAHMSRIPFRYYIFAFQKYVSEVVQKNKLDAPAAASSYLDLIKNKLIQNPEILRPIIKKIFPSIEYVAPHQIVYNASIEIYGDFLQRLKEIKALCEENDLEVA